MINTFHGPKFPIPTVSGNVYVCVCVGGGGRGGGRETLEIESREIFPRGWTLCQSNFFQVETLIVICTQKNYILLF